MAFYSQHTGAQVDEAIDKALGADAVPTPGSTNLVESGGVFGVVSNRNLLDNPWFTVNQRGLTSYAWNGMQYSVDRWKWDTLSTAPLEVQSDGVNLNASALTVGAPYIRQIIDNVTAYRGKTMTFSAIVSAVSGEPNNGFLRVYSGAGNAWGVYFGTDAGLWTVTFTVPSDATAFVCDIGAYTGKSVKVVAAKLELGSVSTLANDAPPCFAEELAKCQRYYWNAGFDTTNFGLFGGVAGISGDAFAFLVPTPVPMRVATPTITATAHWVRGEGNTIAGYSITTTNAAIINGFVHGIGITKTGGFSALKTYWAAISKLTISCDL